MDIILFTILIIAIFTAAVARSKGRDFLGWLVLGGLFPVLALIAVAAMPSRIGVLHRYNSKQCPSCAEQVRLDAAVCRYCGQAFDLETERVEAKQLDLRRLAMLVFGLIAGAALIAYTTA